MSLESHPEIIKAAKELQKMEKSFQCPICMDMFNKPVALKCCHSFCRRCAEEMIRTSTKSQSAKPKCPICGLEGITKRSLAPDNETIALMNAFEELLQSMEEATGIDFKSIHIPPEFGGREAPGDTPLAKPKLNISASSLRNNADERPSTSKTLTNKKISTRQPRSQKKTSNGRQVTQSVKESDDSQNLIETQVEQAEKPQKEINTSLDHQPSSSTAKNGIERENFNSEKPTTSGKADRFVFKNSPKEAKKSLGMAKRSSKTTEKSPQKIEKVKPNSAIKEGNCTFKLFGPLRPSQATQNGSDKPKRSKNVPFFKRGRLSNEFQENSESIAEKERRRSFNEALEDEENVSELTRNSSNVSKPVKENPTPIEQETCQEFDSLIPPTEMERSQESNVENFDDDIFMASEVPPSNPVSEDLFAQDDDGNIFDDFFAVEKKLNPFMNSNEDLHCTGFT